MSRTFLLQDWTTVRSSLTTPLVQDPDAWLDLDGYSDVSCWIDVAEVTAPRAGYVQLQLQTAPSADDGYFVPIAAPLKISTTAPFLQPSTTPTLVRSAKSATTNNLMRYLRWSAQPSAAGTWDLTFRIHAVAAGSPTFVPPVLPGCALWFRPDLGITLVGSGVSSWNDQSGVGDVNKNLSQGTAAQRPHYNISDASYFGQPTLSFSSASSTVLTSGLWASPGLVQPNTWVIVGHNTSSGVLEYAMDGNDTSSGEVVQRTAANQIAIFILSSVTYANAWGSPSALLAEFNGSSSAIYFNNFTSPGAVGNPGVSYIQSLTLGSHSQAWGGGNYWDGTIAEVIAYAGLLSPAMKAQLRSYLSGRYGLLIG